MATTPATAQSYVDAIDTAVQSGLTNGYVTLSLDGVGSGTRYSLKDLMDLRKYYAAIANAPQKNSPALPRRTLIQPKSG